MSRFHKPGKRLKVTPEIKDVRRFMSHVRQQTSVKPKRFGLKESALRKLGPCWLWKAHKDDSKYGQFKYAGKALWAHRFSYAMFRGTIPDDLQIDHRCHNPQCVNPHHLRRKTKSSNVAESNRHRARVAALELEEAPF